MRISVESSNGVAESNRGVGSADALDTKSVVHALKEVIAQAVGTNSSEQATQIASLERRAVALEKIVEQQVNHALYWMDFLSLVDVSSALLLFRLNEVSMDTEVLEALYLSVTNTRLFHHHLLLFQTALSVQNAAG